MAHVSPALFCAVLGVLAIATAANGQPAAPPASSAPPASGQSYFVVFNKAGPNWARVRESAERVRAHQQIYRRLADEGQLIVGGVLVGDTPLGVAIFCPGVDRTAIRRELENDELVTQEMIALEYREWRTQMGELQHRCPPA